MNRPGLQSWRVIVGDDVDCVEARSAADALALWLSLHYEAAGFQEIHVGRLPRRYRVTFLGGERTTAEVQPAASVRGLW